MDDLDLAGRAESGLDSNKVTRIFFVDDPADWDKEEGHAPLFTHQIFGEHERIQGYSSASIKIAFAAGSMACHAAVRKRKLPPGDTTDEPDDIEGLLEDVLGDTIASKVEFAHRVRQDRGKFRPLGTKMLEYSLPTQGGDTPAKDGTHTVFELYRADPSETDVIAFHRRVELLAFFYIDAANKIELDHRWEIFYLFAKHSRKGETWYTTVGYSTVAIFYHHPNKERRRIAQFLILPPYQRQRHGVRMYEGIMQDVLDRPETVDLTVEAPAEQFQLMRDRCDVKRVLALPDVDRFIKLPLKQDTTREFSRLTKLSQRQAARVLEILLLKRRSANPAEQRAYRLHVKGRLARENEISVAAVEGRREKQEQLRQMYEAEEAAFRSVLNSL